ncbi:MAG: biotin--[acetyl-CoA-carboxylase] ligase [Bacilli bacterium]|nr:biotin--[acetyl-CoA-carboxylase] ligase [Bacilli bacterium]
MTRLHFTRLDSTNAYLKVKYPFLNDWTVVTADFQQHGHGRFARTWESHPGENLLCSVLIKNSKTFKVIDSLSLLVGVVIYRVLTKLGLKNVMIKWPNDVYVNDAKICGILLESKSSGDKLQAVIIGVGLNLNQQTFSKEINATSYYREKHKTIKVEKVLNMFLRELKMEITKLHHHRSQYLKIVNGHNYLYGKKGYVMLKGRKSLATLYDVNPDNSLNIEVDHQRLKLTSNEVILK